MNSKLPESKLFDSYHRKIVHLDGDTSGLKDTVKIYTCGPTVYNYQSIGNMRAVWLGDTLARTYKLAGYKVSGF